MLQLAVWLLIGGTGWADYLHKFIATLNVVPAPALSPFVALLGVLGLIAVFTTGLLLDLLGSSYFRMVKMRVFVREAREHIHWFQGVADLYKAYIQEDWSLLLNIPPYKGALGRLMDALSLWNKRGREDFLLYVRRIAKVRRAYTRMQSFLLSYVLLTSGVEKLELLSTQMSLWNSGRAIATVLFISAIEVSFSPLSLLLLRGRRDFEVQQGTVVVAVLGCELLLLILGLSVARGAYQRVCSTLFALVYVISERKSHEAMSVSAVPPTVLAPAPAATASDKQASGE